jgi:c-di-GMP-binding flagellar brake protein YcgR
LTDLSVGGLSALWQSDKPEPELGSTLRHCRIEATGIAAIPCDLRVVRVDRENDAATAQLSCEFYAMPEAVARFVQLYVMDIEKRARLG